MTLCEFIRCQDSIPVLCPRSALDQHCVEAGPHQILHSEHKGLDSCDAAINTLLKGHSHRERCTCKQQSEPGNSREGNVVGDRATDTWFARRLRSSPYQPAAIAVPAGSEA